jgi:hypothetical protein
MMVLNAGKITETFAIDLQAINAQQPMEFLL